MIKIKIKSGLDEAAKWRGTGYQTEFTQGELDRLIEKYGIDNLCVRYDEGVPSGGKGIEASGKDEKVPQTGFNPHATWNTPVGIYYYPMRYAYDKIFENDIPFAAQSKYIYIYRIKDRSGYMDVKDVLTNGFFERMMFWAANNRILAQVLMHSQFKPKTIRLFHEALKIPLVYGNPDISPEENIKSFMITAFASPRGGTIESLSNTIIGTATYYKIKNLDEYLEKLAYSFCTDYLGPEFEGSNPLGSGGQGMPRYTDNPELWQGVLKEILLDAGIAEFFKNVLLKEQDRPEFAKGFAKWNDDEKQAIIKKSFNALRDQASKIISDYVRSGKVRAEIKPTVKSSLTEPLPPETLDRQVLSKVFNKEKTKVIRVFYILNNMFNFNMNKTSLFLLKNGVTILEDNGLEAIHPMEPNQGVILKRSAVELVDVYLNIFRTGRKPKRGDDPALLSKKSYAEKEYEKLLKQFNDEEGYSDDD